MEFGDILYIVVLIVFILSGFLKKKKKVATKDQANPTPSFSGNEMQNYDDWYTEKEAERPYVKEKPLNEEIIINYNSAKDISSYKSRQKQEIKETKKYDDSKITNEDDFLSQIELNTQEQAKKAFIYSEIFQRKY